MFFVKTGTKAGRGDCMKVTPPCFLIPQVDPAGMQKPACWLHCTSGDQALGLPSLLSLHSVETVRFARQTPLVFSEMCLFPEPSAWKTDPSFLTLHLPCSIALSCGLTCQALEVFIFFHSQSLTDAWWFCAL